MKKALLVVFVLLPLMIFTYACSQSESIVSSVSEIDVPSVSSMIDNISHVGEVLKPSSAAIVSEKPADEADKVDEVVKEETTQEVLPEVSSASEVEEVVQISSLDEGKSLFNANCAACHAGGVNRVVASKSLKKDALIEYDMYSQDAIAYQITNGKNAMPAFKGRLEPEQIQNIAAYVLNQADNNWSDS